MKKDYITKEKENRKLQKELEPLEIVKQYMLEEIYNIRKTRIELKNKYPELFSNYVEK